MPSSTDEDLAVKPTSPLVDNVLGALFIGLLLRLLHALMLDVPLALQFSACLIAVVVFSKAVAWGAGAVGAAISRCRRGAHIPPECQHPLRTALKQRKFADQAWQLAIHASMGLFEAFLLHGTTWWEDPATAFAPCPAEFVSGREAHSPELRFFYVLQLAIWVWTGFSCKWIESRRKDYVEMMLHHIVTFTLILYSMINGELAIGLVVLFVHDVSDVVLDLMKMLNYLKMESAHGWFAVEAAFVCNLFSWAYFRLYVFPVYVVYRGAYVGYADQCGAEGAVGHFERCKSAGSCLQSDIGLCVLCCLHVFWFGLILRIAVKLVTGTGASQAGREDYEGLSESDTDTLKRS